MSTQMNQTQFEEFMSAITKLTTVMENLSLQTTKDNVQSVSGQKVSDNTVVTSIRQEVMKKVAAKAFSQSFHKSIMFKKAQRALVESTDPTSIQGAYDKALQKAAKKDSKAPDKILTNIQKIKECRNAKKPIQNRSLIGFFSSIATCDWDEVLSDDDKEIYHAMEMFLKENVQKFYDENMDLYKRVRNKDSIIKDFRTAICKSWASNGFNMEFTDNTKLQIEQLSKNDIQEWIDKLNMKTDDNESKSSTKMSKKEEVTGESEEAEEVTGESEEAEEAEEDGEEAEEDGEEAEEAEEEETTEMELDVGSDDDSEDENQKVVKKSSKKRLKRRASKKSSDEKTDDEIDSKKSVSKSRRRGRRGGRPVRTMAQVSESEESESDSD